MNALQSLPDKKRKVYVATDYDKLNRSVIVRVKDEGIGMTLFFNYLETFRGFLAGIPYNIPSALISSSISGQ